VLTVTVLAKSQSPVTVKQVPFLWKSATTSRWLAPCRCLPRRCIFRGTARTGIKGKVPPESASSTSLGLPMQAEFLTRGARPLRCSCKYCVGTSGTRTQICEYQRVEYKYSNYSIPVDKMVPSLCTWD
jgi:hypothetical protein